MNTKFIVLTFCGIVLIVLLVLMLRAPITGGSWTKQTIYLWLIDYWHGQTNDAKARIMLIDDDSENGIYKIKEICDNIGTRASFAVIPSRIDNELGDSLRKWQKEGFGICLHGYNHDRWKEWTYNEVVDDIHKSEATMKNLGFNTGNIKYIVPPHSCNTRNIRQAIEDEGYQMVCGASIVNPDTKLFQLGRIFISKDTDLQKIQTILTKAKNKKMFVILGTHSSNSDEFSEEKTTAVLSMAKDMGFEFYY